MALELEILIPLFFIIALLYSSAGFGGGSSYLAVLALSSIPFAEFRMIALICNITVVSGSVWIFYRAGYLQLKHILPLVLLSIPMAYLGGRLKISESAFFIILGATLLGAGLMMLVKEYKSVKKLPAYFNGVIGGGIGFLSGVVGIGGGIFLAPLLHLSRWADAKVIAATTALFILVNSISGLIGQIITNGISLDPVHTAALVVAAMAGGQIGSRYSAQKLNPIAVSRIAAVLIIMIALRIILKNMPI